MPAQASWTERASAARAATWCKTDSRRSPTTWWVISITVASTPPIPRGAVSSGTGL